MGFRFQTLEVYKLTLAISGDIFILLNELQNKREYVIADQLMRAFLSISNNIAEGSGSNSEKEFAYFLNIARRSVFECVNIMMILQLKGLIPIQVNEDFTEKLELISKKLQSLRNSILKKF
jgi:four helix bundle protein